MIAQMSPQFFFGIALHRSPLNSQGMCGVGKLTVDMNSERLKSHSGRLDKVADDAKELFWNKT